MPTVVVTIDGVPKPPLRIRVPTGDLGVPASVFDDEWPLKLTFANPRRNRTIAKGQYELYGRDPFVIADAAAIGRAAAAVWLATRGTLAARNRAALQRVAEMIIDAVQDRIFDASPGALRDLKPATKRLKDRLYGDHYPVLVAEGQFIESFVVTGRGVRAAA